jgi:TonB family protein
MLANGSVLQNRYLIKRLLAQGGMGAVYEAEAIQLGGVAIALKQTLFGEDQKFLRDQFQLEAKMLARLKHRALPRVSDHFVEEAGQFLVMEFIPGDDLGALLERRREAFDPPQVMNWADTLLDALDYIHTQDPPIIHRDIKPQNLKLTPRGELYLLDFGLAKDATTPTHVGKSIHGFTAAYAPPEQIKREGTDARSDIFSLAATLYHLLTNEYPQDARLREEFMRHSMPDPLRPAHQANPRIPFALSAVIARAMALERDRRYNSAADMRQALGQTRQTIAEDQRRQEDERRLHEESRQTAIIGGTTLIEVEEERRLREEAHRREIEEQRRQEAARLAEAQRREEERRRMEEERELAVQREIEERRRREGAARPGAGMKMISLNLEASTLPLGEPESAPARSRKLVIIGAALAVALVGLIGWLTLKDDANSAQINLEGAPGPTATLTPTPLPKEISVSGAASQEKAANKIEGAPSPTITATPAPPPREITQSGGVLSGKAITKVQPAYPPIARAAGASGAVQVEVLISEEGRVIEAAVIRGHPLLRDAALQAARQWVFQPSELSGVRVKVRGILTFNFTLQ